MRKIKGIVVTCYVFLLHLTGHDSVRHPKVPSKV